jgi:histidyl-tRNA synthetase
MARKLDKQLKYANAVRARKLIVIGPAEVSTGVFKVKDMTTGEEKEQSNASF